MAKQTINIGSAPNDSTGDPLRTAFSKVNNNFDELYSEVGNSNFRFSQNTMTTTDGNVNIAPTNGAVVTGSDTQVYISAANASVDMDTGALVVAGGVGIAGNVNIGGLLYAASAQIDALDDTPIGADSPSTGVFTTLTASELTVVNTLDVNTINADSIDAVNYTGGTVNVDQIYGNTATVGNVLAPNAQINNLVSSNIKVTGGSISGVSISITGLENTPIGVSTPNTAVFTKMTTVNAQISGGSIAGVNITPVSVNGAPIGNSSPSTGAFTTLTATSGYQGATSGAHNGTVGGATPNTGAFTTVTTSGAGSATTGAGQLYLNGATSNRIDYSSVGLGAPALNTRSAGTKIVLYPGVDATGVDYGIGIETGAIWQSVHDSAASFKWYANASPVATLTGTGSLTVQNQLIGYLTGAIGANTPNSGVFTTVTTTSGGQVTGYHTGAIGANTPNTVVATSVTTTSGGQITGYLTGAIGANTPNAGTFTTITVSGTISGNVTGNLTGVASSATTAGTATYASTAGLSTAATTVVQPAQGNITSVGTLTTVQVSGISYLTGGVSSTADITTTGNVSAGYGITGSYGGSFGNLEIQGGNLKISSSFTIGSSIGNAADIKGKIVWDSGYVYVCTADYDGINPIWKRATLGSF